MPDAPQPTSNPNTPAPGGTPAPGPTPAPGSADAALPHRYTPALANRIEEHWQRVWDERQTYRVPNPGEDGFDPARPKFYCLDMFPYPSGAGLHVGHPEGYTATDILCRYKRMRGCNVLHPMGWDAFGLPAEQYAIQTGIHPAITTRQSIDTFRRQLKRFGFSYDWSREVSTAEPDFYKWTQWIFLRLYNAWYDAEAQKARPVSDLIAMLQSNRAGVGPSGELVRLESDLASGPIAGDRGGTRLWHEMTQEERRIFLDNHRLAYLDEQVVNWCPKLGTVLANDEVIDGRSERGGHPVLRRPLKQWMFRITAYAERLLRDLDTIDWPESTKTIQREWIGRSEGAEIDFPLAGEGVAEYRSVRVFTTRPDTIFGATFMVLAPEHAIVDRVLSTHGAGTLNAEQTHALKEYVREARNRAEVERKEAKAKTGAFTGLYAVNPATGENIPVWVADYVLAGYGHGAIMAVPAHDERDSEFARAMNLPVRTVVRSADGVVAPTPAPPEDGGGCYSGAGVNVNSAGPQVSLDGLSTPEAKERISAWLEKEGLGARRVNYRLRDWLFSRQRYWGEPFPIVFDERGEHHALRDEALPVTLPELADYAPEESPDPRPLLAKARDWMTTTAHEAGVDEEFVPPKEQVTRETNTMPGSAGSSWYFLRYCDPRNATRFVSEEAERYWMNGGVDFYIGGAEHAVGHLLYARFWHKVLFDLGLVSAPEPFKKLFHQGMITAFAYQRADKSLVAADEIEVASEQVVRHTGKLYVERGTGAPLEMIVAKMSKSLKNVVNPDDVIAEFGADTFRLYEMYMGPLEASKPWNPRDIAGCFRFLARAWRVLVDEHTGALRLATTADPAIDKALHRTLHKVGHDVERLAFNTAIAAMIELVNTLTASAGNQGAGPSGGAAGGASGGASGGAAGGASGGALTREQAERFALMLAPFCPHMAEELWHKLGHLSEIALEVWPHADAALLVDDEIEVPVQILGKVRHRLMVPAKAQPAEIEAKVLADAKVQELIAGKPVKRVIVVPGKLVNIVTG